MFVFMGVQLLARKRLSVVLIPTAFTALGFSLIGIATKSRIRKAYESLEIVLGEQGVEWKSPMLRYKNILYANMTVEEKPDGSINIYDSDYSWFQRKFGGQGWINIPKEVDNRDELLGLLESKAVTSKY